MKFYASQFQENLPPITNCLVVKLVPGAGGMQRGVSICNRKLGFSGSIFSSNNQQHNSQNLSGDKKWKILIENNTINY